MRSLALYGDVLYIESRWCDFHSTIWLVCYMVSVLAGRGYERELVFISLLSVRNCTYSMEVV